MEKGKKRVKKGSPGKSVTLSQTPPFSAAPHLFTVSPARSVLQDPRTGLIALPAVQPEQA